MSALSLHYDLQDAPIVQRLRALAALGGDPEPIARAIAFEGEQSTRRRFATETDPDGKRWPDSARKTKRGGKTLTASGQLAGSITSEARGSRAQWGTNKIYAAIHQYGADDTVDVAAHTRRITQAFGRPLSFPVYQTVGAFKRDLNMPKRAYLGISADDEAAFQDIAEIKLRAAAERGDAR